MKTDRLLKAIGLYTLVAIIVIFSFFPFYYAIVTAFNAGNPFKVVYWFSNSTLQNFKDVLSQGMFVKSIVNSLFVASSVVILSSLLSITASYALGRVQFKGRSILLLTILSVSMFPQIAVLTGLFQMIKNLGWTNSYQALIFSYMIFTLPFTVWVLTTFMRGLPKELEEAAMVDGANPLQIVFKVFMPLMLPAMITTGLLAFIAAWNEFLFALTFMQSDRMRTVPVAIANFSGASDQEIPFKAIMAASVIVTVPLIILVLIFQRKIVSGLTAGAVKG